MLEPRPEVGFLGGIASKILPASADVGDTGLIPASGRSPGEERGNPLQATFPGFLPGKSHGQRNLGLQSNPMEIPWTEEPGVAKSWT